MKSLRATEEKTYDGQPSSIWKEQYWEKPDKKMEGVKS